MNSSFSHALRVLICSACGGAMHVAVEGGSHACDVCDGEQEIAPRAEPAKEPRSLSEDERIERLRGGDPALPGIPDEVKELTTADGVLLREDAAGDAMALWQQIRVELADDPDSADERVRAKLFHLTMLLYRHMKAQKDDLQLRAVLESAVEATQGHRDQQIFRCVLSRAAARAGDRPAADDWLAPCDERAVDLHADGAYRYTAAYIGSYKKQFPRVLELLGMRVGDVPFANNLDVICSVLRANAHERCDDLEAATLELADCMGRAPNGASEVERVIRSSGALVLCRNSFVRGRRFHDRLAGNGNTNAPDGSPLASPALKKALPWVVLSLFFFGLAVMTDSSSKLTSGQRLDVLFFVLAVSFAVPLIVLLVRRRT